jgi:hypothetical protein
MFDACHDVRASPSCRDTSPASVRMSGARCAVPTATPVALGKQGRGQELVAWCVGAAPAGRSAAIRRYGLSVSSRAQRIPEARPGRSASPSRVRGFGVEGGPLRAGGGGGEGVGEVVDGCGLLGVAQDSQGFSVRWWPACGCRPETLSRHATARTRAPGLSVPRTRTRHATCTYSCTRPPSRSRRSGRMVAPEGGGVGPAGGC